MPRDEQAVMADIQSTLAQLGHLEFVHALQREQLVADLRKLDAEMARVRLDAALAQVAAATVAGSKDGANGEK